MNTRNIKPKKMIRAECKDMCPDQEFNMRVKNNLVNVLEKKIIGNKMQYNLVKEYSRPAAGKIIRSSDLRTLDTLVKATNYLTTEVYNRFDVDFIHIYEYLFDRYRAIRQDLIIQRCTEQDAIRMLSVFLRFYILADYKLCTFKYYDEFMNFQHLSEVLQIVIANEKQNKNKPLLYSIFILLNVNSLNTEIAALKRFKEFKKQSPLSDTIDLLNCFSHGNYVRLFRIYKRLPLLCQLAFHRRIPAIQLSMIHQYNTAFSFKNSKYPIANFCDISLIQGTNSLKKYVDCKLISIDNENNIVFSKQKTNCVLKDSREKYSFIDENLKQISESDFLLKD